MDLKVGGQVCISWISYNRMGHIVDLNNRFDCRKKSDNKEVDWMT